MAVLREGGVVPKSYQRREEFEYDHGVDKVDLLPHGVGDPVGARCRGGGRLGEREFDLFLSEGGGGGISFQAASSG